MKTHPKSISTIVVATAIVAVAVATKSVFESANPKTAVAATLRPALVFKNYDLNIAEHPTSVQTGVEQLRYEPTTRPFQPEAQHPPEPTTENTDTGKPPREWQRLTDDWGGIRPKLEERGLTFDGSIAVYFGKNLVGGASTARNGGAYLLNVNVTLDSKKLAGYEGGTVFVNFRNQGGLHQSMDGSIATTSHLYTEARTEISEAWYEQKALDDRLRVRVGKIDANTEFASPANGAEFLNSYASASQTILALPTDPDPSFGVDAFVYPTQHFYAGVGAYDGSLQRGLSTGLLGPAQALHLRSEFLIGEAGATWTLPGSRDGKIGVGVWHHTGRFARFGGTSQSGATGPYLALDQTLWRKNPDQDDDKQGVAMFALAGYSDPAVSAASLQFGGGLKWTGPMNARPEDIVGIGVDYLGLSTHAGSGFDRSSEVTLETFYKMRLNAWLSVEPDLQYIHNPGGVSTHRDAIAITVQGLIDF